MKLEANGMTFDALTAGPEDGRPVLLLHGFPQTSRSWRATAARLADAGHRVIAPDQRGYSPEARPAGTEHYAIEQLVADTVGFADAIDAPQVDLVGHDWGAAIAWHTAVRHPDRVRSLTAVSVPHPDAFGDAIRHDQDQRERSSYMLLFRQEGKAERVLAENDHERLRAFYQGVVAREDVDHYVATLDAPGALTAALDYYRAATGDALGAVAVPTLYVWSTEDLAVGRRAAEDAARHVTAPYRFVELEGITHWIPDQAPDRLAGLILEHLTAT